jgi:hypothetical protein
MMSFRLLRTYLERLNCLGISFAKGSTEGLKPETFLSVFVNITLCTLILFTYEFHENEYGFSLL